MNPTKRLPASTLVEVLILMILGGIVFLSVMDGFGLLRRFLDRTSLQIAGRTEQYAGYFRTADLAGMSDSLLAEDNGALALYRGGEIYCRIERIDSALIVHQGERTDTLQRKVAGNPARSACRHARRRTANGARFVAVHRVRTAAPFRSAAQKTL